MKYSGGFSFDATKNSIKLTRYDENKKLKTYILNKNKFYSIAPKDGDRVEVFNNYEIKEAPYIYVHGKVVKDSQAKYKYFDGMSLKNLFDVVAFRSEIYLEKNKELDDLNKNKFSQMSQQEFSELSEEDKQLYYKEK